jgi:hypothetical protein
MPQRHSSGRTEPQRTDLRATRVRHPGKRSAERGARSGRLAVARVAAGTGMRTATANGRFPAIPLTRPLGSESV